nr:retrovirus-related Pol polyprotein from transposon TNT 1-94 [Tanacetum cinerariifolium]
MKTIIMEMVEMEMEMVMVEIEMEEMVMIPEEEDRVEKFIRGLPDNIQGNVIAAELTRLQDAVRIANNLMDKKLKHYVVKNAENKRIFDTNHRDNRDPGEVLQMDVKSIFLNGKLNEEVYVKQSLGFESSEFPDYVSKLDKSLYGLNQSPMACSLVKTPMVPTNNLGPDLAGKLVNETIYREMIGSLMYLTAARSDIQFSIILYARYQSSPKESHLITVKRILMYLK